MADLKQFLRFPFEDREWLVKMLLGSVITIIPILNFLSLGYFIRSINYGWRGSRKLPNWDNWSELFRDGFMVFVISLGYLTIPLILGSLIAMIPGIGIALASIIIFIMGLIIPMAIANFAIRRNVRDAFSFGEIFYLASRVFNFYVISCLAATLGVIMGIALLIGIPLIGFIGGVFIFYCGVVFSNFLGTIYHEATRR
jgi:hypothetical protein